MPYFNQFVYFMVSNYIPETVAFLDDGCVINNGGNGDILSG